MMRPSHVPRKRQIGGHPSSPKRNEEQTSIKEPTETTSSFQNKKPRIIIDLSNCRYEVVRSAALSLGWIENKKSSNDWTILWMDTSVAPERVMKLSDYQRINHFPGMNGIARKIPLARNFARMKKMFPEHYNFMPEQWSLPHESNEFKKSKLSDNHTFIIKPSSGCQGKGIVLSKDKSEVDKYGDAIVQIYLDKPFLIDGFKFDLRVYVLILCIDPLVIYMYKDGLVRLCTEQYKPPSLRNLYIPKKSTCMHLTNYSINKQNDNFESSDDDFSKGSKRNFSFLSEYVDSLGHSSKTMWDDVASVIVKTILSIQPQLKEQYDLCMHSSKNGKLCCFELLGFDIFLDQNLKAWLLEVNHSPSFNTDAAIDQQVKFSLLQETMNMLALDPFDRIKCKKIERAKAQVRITGKLGTGDSEQSEDRIQQTKRILQAAESRVVNYQRIYPTAGSEVYDSLFDQARANGEKQTVVGQIPRVALNNQYDKELGRVTYGESNGGCTGKQCNTTINRGFHKDPTRSKSVAELVPPKSTLYRNITSRYMQPTENREVVENVATTREKVGIPVKERIELPLSRNTLGLDVFEPNLIYGSSLHPTTTTKTTTKRRALFSGDRDLADIVHESELLLDRFTNLLNKHQNGY